jgi:hypothetical protein
MGRHLRLGPAGGRERRVRMARYLCEAVWDQAGAGTCEGGAGADGQGVQDDCERFIVIGLVHASIKVGRTFGRNLAVQGSRVSCMHGTLLDTRSVAGMTHKNDPG